jgi:hypothetical protein
MVNPYAVKSEIQKPVPKTTVQIGQSSALKKLQSLQAKHVKKRNNSSSFDKGASLGFNITNKNNDDDEDDDDSIFKNSKLFVKKTAIDSDVDNDVSLAKLSIESDLEISLREDQSKSQLSTPSTKRRSSSRVKFQNSFDENDDSIQDMASTNIILDIDDLDNQFETKQKRPVSRAESILSVIEDNILTQRSFSYSASKSPSHSRDRSLTTTPNITLSTKHKSKNKKKDRKQSQTSSIRTDLSQSGDESIRTEIATSTASFTDKKTKKKDKKKEHSSVTKDNRSYSYDDFETDPETVVWTARSRSRTDTYTNTGGLDSARRKQLSFDKSAKIVDGTKGVFVKSPRRSKKHRQKPLINDDIIKTSVDIQVNPSDLMDYSGMLRNVNIFNPSSLLIGGTGGSLSNVTHQTHSLRDLNDITGYATINQAFNDLIKMNLNFLKNFCSAQRAIYEQQINSIHPRNSSK